MNTRNMIIFAFFMLFFSGIEAQERDITQLGPNYFVAGIKSADFEDFYAEQECQNWCWAACIQMVLNYHGLFVSQEKFVVKVYGDTICQTANSYQIMSAISGWEPDYTGGYSAIFSEYGVYSASDIVDKLSRHWPIIVGLQNPGGGGHAYVLTAIYYSVDQFNNPIVDKVALRNPWPESPRREEMSWNEFLSRKPEFFKVWVVRL